MSTAQYQKGWTVSFNTDEGTKQGVIQKASFYENGFYGTGGAEWVYLITHVGFVIDVGMTTVYSFKNEKDIVSVVSDNVQVVEKAETYTRSEVINGELYEYESIAILNGSKVTYQKNDDAPQETGVLLNKPVEYGGYGGSFGPTQTYTVVNDATGQADILTNDMIVSYVNDFSENETIPDPNNPPPDLYNPIEHLPESAKKWREDMIDANQGSDQLPDYTREEYWDKGTALYQDLLLEAQDREQESEAYKRGYRDAYAKLAGSAPPITKLETVEFPPVESGSGSGGGSGSGSGSGGGGDTGTGDGEGGGEEPVEELPEEEADVSLTPLFSASNAVKEKIPLANSKFFEANGNTIKANLEQAKNRHLPLLSLMPPDRLEQVGQAMGLDQGLLNSIKSMGHPFGEGFGVSLKISEEWTAMLENMIALQEETLSNNRLIMNFMKVVPETFGDETEDTTIEEGEGR